MLQGHCVHLATFEPPFRSPRSATAPQTVCVFVALQGLMVQTASLVLLLLSGLGLLVESRSVYQGEYTP